MRLPNFWISILVTFPLYFSISVSEKFNKYIEVENKSGHLTILGYPKNNCIGFTD
jgi:hypothetical protein